MQHINRCIPLNDMIGFIDSLSRSDNTCQIRYGSFYAMVLCALCIYTSCVQDDLIVSTSLDEYTPKEAVPCAIYGLINDAEGTPLSGVPVRIRSLNGDQISVSDDQGYFYASNCLAAQGELLISASYPSEWMLPRAVSVDAHSLQYCEVKLMHSSYVLDINGSSATAVPASDDITVNIPEQSLLLDGLIYQGDVKMTLTSDPSSDHLAPRSAMNSAGDDVAIIPYRSIHIQMTTSDGRALTINNDAKVRISWSVDKHTTLLNEHSIPLWKYEDATGNWVQHEQGYRQGDVMVGEIESFGTWTIAKAQWSWSLAGQIRRDSVIQNLAPFQVKLISSSSDTLATFVDPLGQFILRSIPYDKTWTLIVLGDCDQIYAQQTVEPSAAHVDLGRINLYNLDQSAQVKGLIMSCPDEVAPNWVKVRSPNGNFIIPVDSGQFSFLMPLCASSDVPLTFSALNHLADPPRYEMNRIVSRGYQDIGVLSNCTPDENSLFITAIDYWEATTTIVSFNEDFTILEFYIDIGDEATYGLFSSQESMTQEGVYNSEEHFIDLSRPNSGSVRLVSLYPSDMKITITHFDHSPGGNILGHIQGQMALMEDTSPVDTLDIEADFSIKN